MLNSQNFFATQHTDNDVNKILNNKDLRSNDIAWHKMLIFTVCFVLCIVPRIVG